MGVVQKGAKDPNIRISYGDEGERIRRTRKRTADFCAQKGRRPRILVGRIHSNSSDREIKTIAAALADVGFDVDIHTSVQRPHNMARMAVENDVHAVGLPGTVARNYEFISQLINALHKEERADIVVAVWEVFKSDRPDRPKNKKRGNLIIFEMETHISVCVGRILEKLA